MYDTRVVEHPCEKFAGLRDFHGLSVRRYTTLEMTLKEHLKEADTNHLGEKYP